MDSKSVIIKIILTGFICLLLSCSSTETVQKSTVNDSVNHVKDPSDRPPESRQKQWQADKQIIRRILLLPEADIEKDFAALVPRHELVDYALVNSSYAILRTKEYGKALKYLAIAQRELALRGDNKKSIKVKMLYMIIASQRYDNLGVIEYGEQVIQLINKQSDYISNNNKIALEYITEVLGFLSL